MLTSLAPWGDLSKLSALALPGQSALFAAALLRLQGCTHLQRHLQSLHVNLHLHPSLLVSVVCLPRPANWTFSSERTGGSSTSWLSRASSGCSGSLCIIFPDPPRPVVKMSCLMVGVTRSLGSVVLSAVYMFPAPEICQQDIPGKKKKKTPERDILPAPPRPCETWRPLMVAGEMRQAHSACFTCFTRNAKQNVIQSRRKLIGTGDGLRIEFVPGKKKKNSSQGE